MDIIEQLIAFIIFGGLSLIFVPILIHTYGKTILLKLCKIIVKISENKRRVTK